jgi:hypothetical protein
MFMSGAVAGRSAAKEKCAANDGRREGKGTGSAWVAQLVERVLGKDEVTGSIPVPGSRMSIRWLWRMESLQDGKQRQGGGNSTVESHSSKVMVAGSNPVPRSRV